MVSVHIYRITNLMAFKYTWNFRQLEQSIEKILKAESASKIAETEALAGTWDGEIKVVSK